MDIQKLVKLKLADIKKLVFEDEQKFVDTLLADGQTAVKIEPELASGATVSIIDADGNATPAPAGEHALADGTVIIVDESGVITEVKEIEVDEDMKKAQEEMAAQFKEIAEGINAKIAEATQAFTEQIEAYKKEASEAKAAFETATQNFEAEKEKSADFQKEVFTLLTKISEAEAGDKSVASKQNFTKLEKQESAKNDIDTLISNYLSQRNN